MIALKSPITISPAPVNGKAIKPIVLNQIDWSVSYDANSATAFLRGANVPLKLWDATTTPTYDKVGQFTDADVDARVAELLGKDIAASITALYPQPSVPKVPAQPKPVAKATKPTPAPAKA
jgi:hypothetical protein